MTDDEKPQKGQLSEEDKALWKQVMEDVVKLSRVKHLASSDIPKKTIEKQSIKSIGPAKIAQNIPVPESPLQKGIERRKAKKIKQGKVTIDGRIDLHGFTEAKAYEHLLHKIENAHQRGKRCVLVITGKGKDGKGILARRVPEWLAQPRIKEKIINISEALPQHGGSGALYVFLRKNPSP